MASLKMKQKNQGILLPVLLIAAGLIALFYQPILSLITKAEVEVKIEHAPAVLPAAYKVYSNEEALEGKYSLFKMLVTNTGKSTARNVEVSYEIPGYIKSTTVEKIPSLLPGQSVVVNCFPSFDQKIVDKTTASKEKVNITISGSNIESSEETFPIEIKGRNELMYTFIPVDEIRTPGEFFDNAYLISCFVTPEDPIIKYYTQKIQEKILKGETASVENKPEEGVRFLAGIYNATLLSHTVYSGTSGVPSNSDGVSSVTQSIRLPREVVTGRTGLCIELSILYASVMMNAGLDPIIFLIPGHAYPGFRMNGQYYAIEATGIGGEGMKSIASAEQAFQTGMKELNEFFKGAQTGDDRYQILDVRDAIKQGALAMELKDDPFLRQKIDEIAQTFEPSKGGNSNTTVYVINSGGGGGGGNAGGNTGGNNTGTPSGYRTYNGAVSFAYPGSWQTLPQSPYGMPQNVVNFANGAMDLYAEVYQFPGISNPEQAIMMIQQFVANYGGQLQYRRSGQSGSFTVFQGQTYSQNNLDWVAAFKPVNGGVAGVAVGALNGRYSAYQNTINNILNSLR